MLQGMPRKQDTAFWDWPKLAINSWVLTWNMGSHVKYESDLLPSGHIWLAISWQLTHSTYGASYWLLSTHITLQDFPKFTDEARNKPVAGGYSAAWSKPEFRVKRKEFVSGFNVRNEMTKRIGGSSEFLYENSVSFEKTVSFVRWQEKRKVCCKYWHGMTKWNLAIVMKILLVREN